MSSQTIERVVPPPAARFSGKYVRLVSFQRDGTPVATPLWFVADGDRLLAITDARSAKVKRIRRRPEVTVAPCRASGRLTGEPIAACAEILPPSEVEPRPAVDGPQVSARSHPDPARLPPRPAAPRQAALRARASYWRSRRPAAARSGHGCRPVRGRPDEALRRCHGGERPVVRGRGGQRHGLPRPERRREDDDAAHAARPRGADDGQALVLGRRFADLERPASRVGGVLEASDLHPGRSGRDHLRVLARAARLPAGRVEEVLALVELA